MLFNQAVDAALSQNHLRAQPLTPASVDRMNLDRSLAFYQERFADASDFTFVFVGSFDLQTMKPLVEKYLGSLPSQRRNEMVKDVGMRPPAGVVEREVRSGIAPRSQVSIVFPGPFQNDEQHRVIARRWRTRSLATCSGRCAKTWAARTVSASCRASSSDQRGEYRLTITFACDPARTESLVKTAFQVIEDYKMSGPGQGQVADARAALIRDLETNLRAQRVSAESDPVQVRIR